MRHWVRVAAVIGGGIVGGAVAAVAVGSLLWERRTARTIARLEAGARSPARAPESGSGATRRADLPAPVERYLAFALESGVAPVSAARVEWRGEFRTRPDGAWSPFTARQLYTTRPPGFVWDASIRMAPLLTVRVRDSYIDGEGAMRAAVASIATVVDQRGSPRLAASALARYLGELVWLPAALLPGGGVEWTAVDDSTARATLTDGDVPASVDFHFGSRGEVESVSGERYRDVDGTGVLTPWRGRLWDYERVQGMMVPRSGEVAWLLPDGPFAYWRGRLVDASYEPAPW
ncbi:MAG: DUF6920 family protein [Gemmatimonadaceae bacterium]